MNQDRVFQKNFIRQILDKDLALGKHKSIRTRFPPEPNGYLHIGHAKSICINFGLAQDYHGQCNLRIDDTNPVKESEKYVNSIKSDVSWLGFTWNGKVHYASDYFEKLYNYALELIKKGLAYVDQLSPTEIRKYRGTLTSPGIDSPYRNREISENLALFNKMRNGDFSEGGACLRAKIDMASPFMVMRDPVLYRVKLAKHYQTGNIWCIYPTYDFTHCISDAIEGITHSLCTLEFLDNRRLYNWILDKISVSTPHPCQYEFSRLNLEYTVMSKRQLSILVTENVVDGWDDPRMPTISGLRRRGYNAASIREFCRRIGVTRNNCNIKISVLEACIRENLNEHAPRAMAVIDPVRVVIETLPVGYEQNITMLNHPNKKVMGMRQVTFSREIFIDRADFREQAEKQYKRLVLGEEVRLRNACVIKAHRVEKNINGKVTAIFCSHDQDTLNKHFVNRRRVRGIIHWVSATQSIAAEFRLYNPLFSVANPIKEKNFLFAINPQSLVIRQGFVEAWVLSSAHYGKPFQFEREGYFCTDSRYSTFLRPVFNRIVELRSTWEQKNIKN